MTDYINPQFQNILKNDPRYALAQSLLQQGLAPSDGKAGGLGVLAQALSAGIGAYQTNKLSDEAKARQTSASTDLATALGQMNGKDAETKTYNDGTTINWDAQAPNMQAGIQTLGGNPDLADTATTLQLQQLKGKQDLATQLAKIQADAAAPLSTKDKAEFAYKDREMTTDAFGNTIQKYPNSPTQASPSPVAPMTGQTGADIAGGMAPATVAGLDPSIANSPFARKAMAEQAIKNANTPPTESQANAAGFATRMATAGDQVNTLLNNGYTPTTGQDTLAGIPYGNNMVGEKTQTFQQARDNFINSQLRRESGAAIGPQEYTNADRQYFPVPGDKPDVLVQKALNRQQAIESMAQGVSPSVKDKLPTTKVPYIGLVKDGYIFKGGDPASQSNWEKQ